eukprot:TRINITY_DN8053_c0_g1_i3.p3 TRINITY_DN8053_c0_g1~~TRINITY_DN8053_c0_g1_i3.p3  ORF type:complete len:137 (-),score=18.38 TRINITY_DN8053_c0_g1_i3:1209-1559(-)
MVPLAMPKDVTCSLRSGPLETAFTADTTTAMTKSRRLSLRSFPFSRPSIDTIPSNHCIDHAIEGGMTWALATAPAGCWEAMRQFPCNEANRSFALQRLDSLHQSPTPSLEGVRVSC